MNNEMISLKQSNKDKQLCCDECGGDNIEWQVWADEFDVVSDGDGTREIYCANCEEHHKSILKEDYNVEKL